MMFFRAASMICSFHTFLGRFFFQASLDVKSRYLDFFYGRISETINELLMFFRAVSMICNFHTFFFKHLLTLNFNIFGNYVHVPPFFYPGQCGDGFWHHALGKHCRWPACTFCRCAWGTPQFGPWRLTHKESRPGVKVNIIIAYYSRSGAVVRLLRLAKPAALKRALALFSQRSILARSLA